MAGPLSAVEAEPASAVGVVACGEGASPLRGRKVAAAAAMVAGRASAAAEASAALGRLEEAC